MALSLQSFTEPVATALSHAMGADLPLVHQQRNADLELKGLRSVPPADLFPQARDAGTAFSGLLLRIGFWEESHEVAQDLSSVEGSYWHALVHRMEPDYFNSAYWFRRVGQHPIFADQAKEAADIVKEKQEAVIDLPASWNPLVFNTLCENALARQDREECSVLERIHTAEWEHLFRWCASVVR